MQFLAIIGILLAASFQIGPSSEKGRQEREDKSFACYEAKMAIEYGEGGRLSRECRKILKTDGVAVKATVSARGVQED